MKKLCNNILGHNKSIKLYDSCGNLRYEYNNDCGYVEEIFYNEDLGITKYNSRKL